MSTNKQYLEICVAAPVHGISGQYLVEVIRRAINPAHSGWSTLTDFDVSGAVRQKLPASAEVVQVMPTGQALSLMQQAEQIVWGTVFFACDEQSAREISADETYQESTAKSTLVVRVVDGGHIYLISRIDEAHWAAEFPLAEHHTCILEEVSFPE